MYQETRNIQSGDVMGIIRDDGANIPLATGNPDYQRYIEWVAQGNTPTPDPAFTLEKTAARAAERQAIADRRADIVARLSGLADAQIDAYIDINVSNLAGAVAYLKRLTKVVRALAIEAGVK